MRFAFVFQQAPAKPPESKMGFASAPSVSRWHPTGAFAVERGCSPGASLAAKVDFVR
jgi:hypothetical protein